MLAKTAVTFPPADTVLFETILRESAVVHGLVCDVAGDVLLVNAVGLLVEAGPVLRMAAVGLAEGKPRSLRRTGRSMGCWGLGYNRLFVNVDSAYVSSDQNPRKLTAPGPIRASQQSFIPPYGGIVYADVRAVIAIPGFVGTAITT